ncbi:Delta-aminolevulinic acid dehydratase, chloroplastic [Galdieria sulphuraria]|nr:Delta-aminolevulinic acid dehydratase, chloroplastic [Galdieria sulphuraria]
MWIGSPCWFCGASDKGAHKKLHGSTAKIPWKVDCNRNLKRRGKYRSWVYMTLDQRETKTKQKEDFSKGSLSLPQRPRRNRKSDAIRSLTRETILLPQHLVYPIFIHADSYVKPIPSMPDCQVHSISSMLEQVDMAYRWGVQNVILFPKIDVKLKSNTASECYNPNGLVPQAISEIKSKFPKVMVWTDIALDPYSSMGHDGMVGDIVQGKQKQSVILNDETVQQLCRQALCHAAAGADVVAPSDMMDGRIGAIRMALDEKGYTYVSICSYTAKYASSFYGPFRDALDSAPVDIPGVPKDKKTYQMDPGNALEALREMELDEHEGADMLMVKPGLPYLDIIRLIRENTTLPVVVYQVSGEYAMIKAATQQGANAILTYFAKDAAQWLVEQDDIARKSFLQ